MENYFLTKTKMAKVQFKKCIPNSQIASWLLLFAERVMKTDIAESLIEQNSQKKRELIISTKQVTLITLEIEAFIFGFCGFLRRFLLSSLCRDVKAEESLPNNV